MLPWHTVKCKDFLPPPRRLCFHPCGLLAGLHQKTSGQRFLLYEVFSVGHQSPEGKCRGQTCSSRQIEQQILFHRINCMRARLTWRAVHWASSLPLKGVLLIRCQDLTRHTFYTHTHTHTHIPASCPRTIFTSRPRYQNSLFPLSPFYTVIFSVILLSISGEWIISVFTACSRGRYDERQISLSIVSHLLNFYQTVICLQQVYTVKVTGTGRTLMCDVLWHLQSTEQVLGHCSWHSNYLRNIVDWSAISSAAG